jgi:hypothetical protein
MRDRTHLAGLLAVLVGTLSLVVGCSQPQAAASTKPAANAPNQPLTPKIVEHVDVTPGRAIAPQDQAKVASIAMRTLGHIIRAQQELDAKNVDLAKKDVAQAGALLGILKGVLPSVILIESIQVAKTNLAYLNAAEVQQDLVPIQASLDRVYDVLPGGQAKGFAQQAKAALTTEKANGVVKAKAALESVEESMEFSDVDLSVSHVARWVTLAQHSLDQGKTKEAGDALAVAVDGVMFVDFDIVDPTTVAAREIWFATQDWAAKDPKATKTRLDKAKAALQEVVKLGVKSQQDQAQRLIAMIDALDLTKAGEPTGKALQDLWQAIRQLETAPPGVTKK